MTYKLPTGEKDLARLDTQHACYAAGSVRNLYEIARIGFGKVVADVGCGSGATTEWMAEQVGPEGRVYAIDYSKEQLDIVRSRLQASGIHNVDYIKINLEDINNLKLECDIVYARFVVHHLQNRENCLTNIIYP